MRVPKSLAALQGQESSAETEGGDVDHVASFVEAQAIQAAPFDQGLKHVRFYLHEKQHEARKGGQKMCRDEVENWILDDIGVIHRRHEDVYHISRLISFHYISLI